jgi:hypothetical protein
MLAVTNIRLVNGIGLYDGRVEVLMNGTWGTICGTSFSSYEAGTICKVLFDTWYVLMLVILICFLPFVFK